MNLTELIEFFQQISADSPDLHFFDFGSDEEELNSLRDEINYPALFLEVPSEILDGDPDNKERDYLLAFSIVSTTDRGDFQQRKDTWISLEQIAAKVCAQIEESSDRGIKFLLTPIKGKTIGNHYGWRVTCQLPHYIAFCAD